MSEILGNFIAHGSNITHFDEYAHDISGSGGFFVKTKKNRPSMCFSLIVKNIQYREQL